MRKTVEAKIEIALPTGNVHFEDEQSEAIRSRLEYIGFYTQSLFRMIKAAIENLSDFDDQSIAWTLGDVLHTCDIGASLADSIAPLLDIFDGDYQPSPSEAAQTVTFDVDRIASFISALLTIESVPVRISQGLRDALHDLQNSSPQFEVLRLEESTEYIRCILQDYENSNEGNQ